MRSSGVSLRLAVMALLMTAGTGAQPPAYRFERPITPARSGPAVVPFDVPLLVGTQPIAESSLTRSEARLIARSAPGDLRLFDGAGQEVPYLFVMPPSEQPSWLEGTVLPVAATEKTSGFEAELMTPALVDRFQVQGLPAPFLKRVVLEGSGDRERWTLLAPQGTLFDLPMEGLRRLEIAFPRGEFRYFRVTWDDTNSGRVPLPARVSARRVASPISPRPLTARLPFERRASEPGRSRFHIRLPGAQLPIVRLDLEVDATHLMRHATATEARFNGRELQPQSLGSVYLKRVTKDSVRADELSIPITLPRTAELDLVVNDENNPPLALTGVTAVFAELPTIYFESDGRPLVARYGNPRLTMPRYDLEAVRDSLRLTDAAPAAWGEPVARVETTEAVPAPPMPPTGTVLEAEMFRHARDIPGGSPGLAALPLDAAVLSASSGIARNFSDVRVLDGQGRQIPYVVERRDEPVTIDLPVVRRPEPPPGAPASKNTSWYALQLPFANLPPARLALETPARVFRRGVVLQIQNEADDRRRSERLRTLTQADWTHAAEETPATPLLLTVPTLQTRELFLAIDEGDNTALPVQRATLLLPSYRVRFYRPDDAALTLVYGRDDLSAPEYDLALLAPRVLGAPATEVAAGAERAGDATPREPLVTPPVFWGILGLALAVLLSLIVRLVRNEPARV